MPSSAANDRRQGVEAETSYVLITGLQGAGKSTVDEIVRRWDQAVVPFGE